MKRLIVFVFSFWWAGHSYEDTRPWQISGSNRFPNNHRMNNVEDQINMFGKRVPTGSWVRWASIEKETR